MACVCVFALHFKCKCRLVPTANVSGEHNCNHLLFHSTRCVLCSCLFYSIVPVSQCCPARCFSPLPLTGWHGRGVARRHRLTDLASWYVSSYCVCPLRSRKVGLFHLVDRKLEDSNLVQLRMSPGFNTPAKNAVIS